jgi:3-methyladenine DNA glycosylase AlkD
VAQSADRKTISVNTPDASPRGIPWPSAQTLAREIRVRLNDLPLRNAPSVRRLRRKYSQRLRSAPESLLLHVAQLLKGPAAGERFCAAELVHYHTALNMLNKRFLENLASGMDSWDDVDIFSLFLSGPAWRMGRIGDSVIQQWAHSADRWWRRAALVSTVPLNCKARGGTGDTRRTLQVCRQLEDDRDPMVTKALSWALRELAKRDPRSVRTFLSHRGDRLATIVRREVKSKLITGRKNPPRRSRAVADRRNHAARRKGAEI